MDGFSLVLFGKVCNKEWPIVISTGSYSTVVNPDMLPISRLLQQKTEKQKMERVFVVPILSAVIFQLGIMQTRRFKFDIERKFMYSLYYEWNTTNLD